MSSPLSLLNVHSNWPCQLAVTTRRQVTPFPGPRHHRYFITFFFPVLFCPNYPDFSFWRTEWLIRLFLEGHRETRFAQLRFALGMAKIIRWWTNLFGSQVPSQIARSQIAYQCLTACFSLQCILHSLSSRHLMFDPIYYEWLRKMSLDLWWIGAGDWDYMLM